MLRKPAFLVSLLAVAAAAPSHAQSWPAKPIRWISPFAPGGGADFTSRALAQKLGPALGQQVVIDNRGGAGGMVGVDLAAKSPPDGYTLVLGTIGPIAINPSLYSKMPYDPSSSSRPYPPPAASSKSRKSARSPSQARSVSNSCLSCRR